MWNYNRFEDFGHVGDTDMDEIAVWNRCGLTVPCLPRISCSETDPAVLVPLLDRAGSLGMRLIAHIDELTYPGVIRFGEDKYRALCREVYAKIRHPALFGLFIGDEPNGAASFSSCITAMRLQREEMPELDWPAMGRYLYMARFREESDMREFIAFVLRKNNEEG